MKLNKLIVALPLSISSKNKNNLNLYYTIPYWTYTYCFTSLHTSNFIEYYESWMILQEIYFIRMYSVLQKCLIDFRNYCVKF